MEARAVRIIGADSETFLLAPGVAAPKLVCWSWDDGESRGVVLSNEGLECFTELIFDEGSTQVYHHMPFDAGVCVAESFERFGDIEGRRILHAVFQAIKGGRLRCTKIREQILENARGELKFDWDPDLNEYRRSSFTLERCAYNRLRDEDGRPVFVNKSADTWRKRYGLLDGVPLEEWPEDAIKYAIKDADLCRRLFFAQEEAALAEGCGVYADGRADIPGEMATTMAAFCFGLMRIWGMRTNAEAAKIVRAEYEEKYAAVVAAAAGHGLVKNGKRKMGPIKDRVAALYQERGADIPMSDYGKNISTNRDTLTFKRFPGWAKDEALQSVADVVRYQKILTTYVPILERGTVVPITPDWNAMVETWRSSCASPNLQNLPRDTSVRNCFEPRDGWVYVECDYSTIEMRTLAQLCIKLFGYSTLAEAINGGQDVHIVLAADMLEASYDEVFARYKAGEPAIAGPQGSRQGAKIGNYALAGGMGPSAFQEYARAYDFELTFSAAQAVHQGFRRTWREMVDYFNYCSAMCSCGDAETVVHPLTGYVRGQVRYTALANHGFQHPAAVGAKAALCRAIEEAYSVEESPLFGCRVVNFSHDSIMMEVPLRWIGLERASAAADHLSRVMIEEMKVICPDVDIATDLVMMRRWLKGPKPVRQDGLLVPSRKEGKDWVADLGDEERAAA